MRVEDIGPEADQLGGEAGQPSRDPLGVAALDDDVAALDVTEFLQRDDEGFSTPRSSWRVSGWPIGGQKSEPERLPRWLRLRYERRGEREEQRGKDVPASQKRVSMAGVVALT